ncbi:SPOR domain-containing protein [Leptotrichia sp. oral taxon 218]|jgi:sporulation domain protein|uniref:SPOR domain-containing protein n=1 Tax=Leptotrichia sp. oral taxon 218 TaxID=712361 RepID=UPI001B8B43AF|nr:SPOR domain-containing protein [Leptotrichia sp. oral taxon 218]QUB95381.1 SPOR domain-containing protein [Leptotrichia sp. oral taxon 218]
MSYRLNPYKILRSVVILAVIICLGVLAFNFKKSKESATNEIKKDVKVRGKNFFKSKDYKNNLTLPKENIQENNKNVINDIKTNDNKTKNVDLQDIKKDDANKKIEDEKKNQEKAKEQQKNNQQEIEKQKQKAKEEAARIEKEKAQKAKAVAEQKAKAEAAKGPKKYIQVASVKTEAGARSITKKLGGNFYYKKTVVNGKKAYVVMSNMTNDQAKLNSMQKTVKSKYGSDYMIRGGGK